MADPGADICPVAHDKNQSIFLNCTFRVVKIFGKQSNTNSFQRVRALCVDAMNDRKCIFHVGPKTFAENKKVIFGRSRNGHKQLFSVENETVGY
jgi:hypothetical protein